MRLNPTKSQRRYLRRRQDTRRAKSCWSSFASNLTPPPLNASMARLPMLPLREGFPPGGTRPCRTSTTPRSGAGRYGTTPDSMRPLLMTPRRSATETWLEPGLGRFGYAIVMAASALWDGNIPMPGYHKGGSSWDLTEQDGEQLTANLESSNELGWKCGMLV
jgi:hypothetical protein